MDEINEEIELGGGEAESFLEVGEGGAVGVWCEAGEPNVFFLLFWG